MIFLPSFHQEFVGGGCCVGLLRARAKRASVVAVLTETLFDHHFSDEIRLLFSEVPGCKDGAAKPEHRIEFNRNYV